MAVGRWVVFMMGLGIGTGSASAAEVTDMPAPHGVLGHLTYTGSRLSGGLEEQGI
nr:hypothetical protein [Deltaproteobacteria bacterium]